MDAFFQGAEAILVDMFSQFELQYTGVSASLWRIATQRIFTFLHMATGQNLRRGNRNAGQPQDMVLKARLQVFASPKW